MWQITLPFYLLHIQVENSCSTLRELSNTQRCIHQGKLNNLQNDFDRNNDKIPVILNVYDAIFNTVLFVINVQSVYASHWNLINHSNEAE